MNSGAAQASVQITVRDQSRGVTDNAIFSLAGGGASYAGPISLRRINSGSDQDPRRPHGCGTGNLKNSSMTLPSDSALVIVSHRFTCSRIQDQLTVFVRLLTREIEHLIDWAGDTVKTSLTNALPTQPVVLNETQN